MDFDITGLDHVQLGMPAGREADAERFYCDVLGFKRVPKPPALEKRVGFWFEKGSVKAHLGLAPEFRPVRKAHPALLVTGFDEFLRKACLSWHRCSTGQGHARSASLLRRGPFRQQHRNH